MIEQLADSWNYIIVIILMVTGLFIVIARANLIKGLIGLSIFQTSVFLFYISLGKVAGGTAPILDGNPGTIFKPIAVVSCDCGWVATTARPGTYFAVNEAFGSVEEDEIIAASKPVVSAPKRPIDESPE